MATVAEVAKAALTQILVQGADAPLEPEEYQDFIATMNNFMADLEADGVYLGYTVVDNLADEITIPPGAIRGLINNMAVECAPEYGGVVSPELIQTAINGLKVMRKLGQRTPRSRYPGTLPRGTGNHDWLTNSPFYPATRDDNQCR